MQSCTSRSFKRRRAIAVHPLPEVSSPSHLDDRQLWQGIIERDTSALAALYDRYASLALGLACHLLGNKESAEDVVQDTFLRVWRYASTYDPERGPFRSWILSIIRHRCIDILRQRAIRPQTVGGDLDRLEADPFHLWTEVSRRLTRDVVLRALMQLSVEQRTVIELAYFGGFTHAQIAQQLQLPLGTVKGRIRLALAHLHHLLNESPTPKEDAERFMKRTMSIHSQMSRRPLIERS